MKLSAGQVEGFMRKPDLGLRAILIYGPDTGLVRERATILVKAVAEDLADPFRVATLTAQALRDDPARLADEAQAMSLTGGRRAVHVRDGGDAVAAALADVLDAAAGDSVVIVEAGELAPRSKLRQLVEGASNATALPCYADEGAGLAALARSVLEARNITIGNEALAFLVDNLGGDRMMSRSELEKLALYVGDGNEATLDDAMICVGDSATMTLDDAVNAACSGDQAALSRALERLFREGGTPVGVLRATLRHLQRLHLAASRVADGQAPDRAMQALRPPVFFKNQAAFKSQLSRWPVRRLEQALESIFDAERDCKTTGMPAEAVCSRALMRLAVAAAIGRRAA